MYIVTEGDNITRTPMFTQMRIPTTVVTLNDRMNLVQYNYKKAVESKFIKVTNILLDCCVGALVGASAVFVGLVISTLI